MAKHEGKGMAARIKMFRGGEGLPGGIGRTRQESEQAFTAPPQSPPGRE